MLPAEEGSMPRTVRSDLALPAACLLSLALLASTGCVGFAVNSDFDPNADFSGYRSWYWLPPSPSGDPRIDNDLVANRVRGAIERSLAARGYAKTSTGEGDFGVGYHGFIEGKIDVQQIDRYYGYGPGWGRYGGYGGYGGVATETYVDQYDEGTLIIDIVDNRSRKLVWRGSTSARVSEDDSPAERDDRTQRAVDAILEKFPPEKE
jgi:hypothetical protein